MANTVEIIIHAKDEASHVMKQVSAETGGLHQKLLALAPAIGAAVGGFMSFKALEGAIDATAELGAEVRKLSREAGLSAEASSHLIFAFKELGLDGDTASRSMGILFKNMVNTRDTLVQGKDAASPFANSMKVLGITFTTTNGQLVSADKVLGDLADRFKTMPDGPEKTARAIDIFGRSGKDMIPILNQGREGLAEFAKEADDLNVTLSAENADMIRRYTMAQRGLNEAFLGLKVTVAEAVMPTLTNFANWFKDHQADIRGFVQDAIREIGTLVRDFTTGLKVITDGLEWIPNNKGVVITAIAAIGVAMAAAFGPESLALAGLTGIVMLMGQIQKNGIDLGPLGTLGGGGKGPSELAQLYAYKSLLETGDVPAGQKDALKAYKGSGNIDVINGRIAQLEGGAAGGQPSTPLAPEKSAWEPDLEALIPPIKAATDKLVDVFKELGNTFQEAMSKVDEAINSIFGKPSREQLDLQLGIITEKERRAKYGDKSVHFGPGEGPGVVDPVKMQKSLDALDQEHQKKTLQLKLMDATLKTEADLNKEYDRAAKIIPGYTANLKLASDTLGISTNPALDNMASAASAVKDSLTGPTGLMDGIFKAANALRALADPNADKLGPGGTTDAKGEATGWATKLLLARP